MLICPFTAHTGHFLILSSGYFRLIQLFSLWHLFFIIICIKQRRYIVAHLEHTEQSKFITFCRHQGGQLAEIFAIPNGAYVSKREAVKLAREGMRSGPSDLCLPEYSSDGRYPILWLEFKRPDGKGVVSAKQTEFMGRRQSMGHKAVVVHSAVEAVVVVMKYIYNMDINNVEGLALLNRAMTCPV